MTCVGDSQNGLRKRVMCVCVCVRERDVDTRQHTHTHTYHTHTHTHMHTHMHNRAFVSFLVAMTTSHKEQPNSKSLFR